ncbi:MAG: isocitrate/isopropylmalate family dehydrogenase, partial [bacterium]
MANHEAEIRAAQEQFAELIRSEFERIEAMKADKEVKDFSKLDHIKIGILPGDGIGPIIMEQALRVVKELLKDEIASGRIEIHEIEGMTIEHRAETGESLPPEVFEECKKCDVLVK